MLKPALEMGVSNPTLAIGDEETNVKGAQAYTPKNEPEIISVPSQPCCSKECLAAVGRHFVSWFLVPGLLVMAVAAGDQQQLTFEKVEYERIDVALGCCCGVICSAILAVFAGRWMKWYFHDTHLLLYICLVFFGVMVANVQSTVIHTMLRDVPMRVTEGASGSSNGTSA